MYYNMRILVYLFFGISSEVKNTSEKSKGNIEVFCNSTELELPKYAESWICEKSIQSKVLKGGKCDLLCQRLFKPKKGSLI